MKSRQVVLAIIAVLALTVPQLRAQYYYSHEQQQPLRIDSVKVCLKFEAILGQDDQGAIIDAIPRIVSALVDDHAIDGFVVCSLSTNDDYAIFLDSVQAINGIYLVEPYYRTFFDSPSFVGDRFCVAFSLATSEAEIDSINTSFGTVIDYEFEGMTNVFVLRNNPATGYRIVDLANAYYELTQTRFAHPIFGVRIEKHAYKLYDHFNIYQPHTKKVIGQFNIASVWDFAGLTQPKTVAVLDDGVNDDGIGDAAHEDLQANRVLPGRNFVSSVLSPEPNAVDHHGMACAGVISASHTTDSLFGLDSNSGVISLAPNVQILPVKFLDSNVPIFFVDSIAKAINYAWQNGGGVLSNSWGFGAPCPFGYDLITAAIDSARNYGRNGRGCPVIFSAGNSSPTIDQVQYPACLSSSFAVGAIQLSDTIWNYSQSGDSLDIVAPSGKLGSQGDVWTIDQPGKNGANFPGPTFTCQPGQPEDGDYLCSFGGTSAAAPVVAGIAALLLSKDTNLTAQEVYNILDSSAVTQLVWGSLPDTPDVKYGYGRVDAFRAILSISRGDLNNDNQIATVLDLTFLIDRIYRGGPPPFPSPSMGDCNCDGAANTVIDLTFLVDFIFRGSGIPPVNPCYKF